MQPVTEQELENEEDALKNKYLTFAIGPEIYGIEIRYVTEIVGVQAITEIPELPEYIKGIINLRGKIIPVMDVRLRFRKPFKSYNDRTCIVVVDIRDISIGLIVDRVDEVISIPQDQIVSPPEMSSSSNRYIQGIGKVGNEVKLLLHCDELIHHQEAEALAELAQV